MADQNTIDAQLQRDIDETNAAGEADSDKNFLASFKQDEKASQKMSVARWAMNLPKNISGAVMTAAMNTIDTGSDLLAGAAESGSDPTTLSVNMAVRDAKTKAGIPQTIPKFSEAHPELWKTLSDFHKEYLGADGAADELTQGVAQFAIPFAGWSRALGLVRGAGAIANIARGAGAEAITVASAYGAHDPRMADLAELGRHSEGKLGDTLRMMSPDGSLLNTYIQYMADRDNEGEWEGRLKNVIDNSVVSAAAGGVLMAGVKELKAGKTALRVTQKAPGLDLNKDLGIEVIPSSKRPGGYELSVNGQNGGITFMTEDDAHKAALDLADSLLGDHTETRVPPRTTKTQLGNGELPPDAYDELFAREGFSPEEHQGTKAPELHSYVSKNKEHVVESDTGAIIMRPDKNYLRVRYAKVKDPGKGEGTRLYERAVRDAEAHGKIFASDTLVSESAARVYDKLEKQGFVVTRNPAEFDSKAKVWTSKDPTQPVFEIRSKLAADLEERPAFEVESK